ncbi:hypothetical protein SCLCIDRAFT_139130, partial [Scleroderma citrinum Foug A]
EKIGAFDTRVLAIHNNQIITSPNCDFIPEPFIFDDAPLEPLRDRRFGIVDCFQWLQLHAEQYIWSACIPWQAVYRDDPVWSLLWWNLSQLPSKFVLERGSTFEVGRVHPMKFQQLEAVYQHIDERAQKWHLTFTFCDTVLVVTLFQCLCLDIFGMLDWLTTPIPLPSGDLHLAFDRWMGTFTTDPEVCQRLFNACVPVWLVRSESTVPFDMNVRQRVEFTTPPISSRKRRSLTLVKSSNGTEDGPMVGISSTCRHGTD